MDQFQVVVRYLGDHPFAGLALATALLGVYHLLNRKSRLTREADERLKQLCKQRGDYYRKMRRPR
ncbi:MAG: hypothetical protein ABSA52_00700 [Candidatus Binatia bacterium]|jgi:hypothetical protein